MIAGKREFVEIQMSFDEARLLRRIASCDVTIPNLLKKQEIPEEVAKILGDLHAALVGVGA